MKKNALIIAYNSLNNSGVPNVIYNTILALNGDFNFDVITFNSDNDFYLNKLSNENINVNIYCLDKIKSNNILCKIFWNLFVKYKYWKKEIDKILCRKKYDVIHSFKEYNGYIFLKEAKKANIKIRLNHTNVIHSKNKNLLLRIIDYIHKQKTNKFSTTNIAVSKNAGNAAFTSKKFTVIHNTFDEKNYYFIPKTNKSLKIIQVGTFSTNKNQLFSIEVFKKIIEKDPTATMSFYGHENEPNYLSKINQQINESNLQKNVQIIDSKNCFPVPYNEFNISIIPSKSEGASIVAIESQSCGLKVIASTNVPREMNLGGITFLDLKKGPEFWAKYILQMYQNGLIKEEYNLQDFAFNSFKNKISSVYNNKI